MIVLGGRDRRDAYHRPDGAEPAEMNPLRGYKGIALQIDGQPLVSVIIERMAATGVFSPIWIAGPARLYHQAVPGVRVIDTDSSFGDNLRTAVETVREELDAEYVAVTTADILPDPDELQLAARDLVRHVPLDFWMPHVPIEASLGSSDWKPRYGMRPPGEPAPLGTLPGHLVVGNLDSIRFDFVYRLFDLFYQTRNRPVLPRTASVAKGIIAHMLREDLAALATGKAPYALFTVFREGVMLALNIASQKATTRDLEDRIRKISMRRDYRRLFPNRRGRIAVLDVMSLARDIDTEEEARELTDTSFIAPAETAGPDGPKGPTDSEDPAEQKSPTSTAPSKTPPPRATE
ncbi:MAG: hypothetical protein AAGM22_12550 [Acidobacteriota bacterium]